MGCDIQLIQRSHSIIVQYFDHVQNEMLRMPAKPLNIPQLLKQMFLPSLVRP